jgi:hypothetical protein
MKKNIKKEEEESKTMIIVICFCPGYDKTLQHIKVSNQFHAPAFLPLEDGL